MSARKAMVGPGLPPVRTAVTPVWVTPVLTASPRLRRCSATSRAVSRGTILRAAELEGDGIEELEDGQLDLGLDGRALDVGPVLDPRCPWCSSGPPSRR
jgi:hypothetical protein